MNYATQQSFAHSLMDPGRAYSDAVDWFKDHASPEDIFDAPVLIETVKDMCFPEQVFSVEELSAWATENGFTKTT